MESVNESCSVIVAGDSFDLVSSAEIDPPCAASIPEDEQKNKLILPRNSVRQSLRNSKESSFGSQPKLVESCSLSHSLKRGRRRIKSFRRDFEADIAPEVTTSENIAIPRPIRRPLKRNQCSDAIVREPLPSNLRAKLLGTDIPNIDDESEKSNDDFVPVSDERLQKFCEKVMEGRKRRERVKNGLPLYERCCDNEISNFRYTEANVETPLPLHNQCTSDEKKSPVSEELPRTDANKNNNVIENCNAKCTFLNEKSNIIIADKLNMYENDQMPEKKIKDGIEDELCVVPVRRCSGIADSDFPRIDSVESVLVMGGNTEDWSNHNSRGQSTTPTVSNRVNFIGVDSCSGAPTGVDYLETKSQSNCREKPMVRDKLISIIRSRSNIKSERKLKPLHDLTSRMKTRCCSPLPSMIGQGSEVVVDAEKGKFLEAPLRLTFLPSPVHSRGKEYDATYYGNAPKEFSRDFSSSYRPSEGTQGFFPHKQVGPLVSLCGSPECTKTDGNSTKPHIEMQMTSVSPPASSSQVTKLPHLRHYPKRLL
ncbi:hypothetical protein LSM04_004302 [Trypanosoma melophagium]|uniref:uncharacterized protein n=1 Tax=Trypanosoma melophagium TaxID=715481 RepID=UPI00351A0755|nr:hypothetical protein LSM04_004302 [Trypanosoma melophagium]